MVNLKRGGKRCTKSRGKATPLQGEPAAKQTFDIVTPLQGEPAAKQTFDKSEKLHKNSDYVLLFCFVV